MARKNILAYKLVGNQSLSASFNTAPTFIAYLDNFSYQINITTTNSVGTFAVQSSDDYAIDEITGTLINPGTWVSLTLGGGTPSANAANDTISVSLNQPPFKALRLAYTAGTPGTGTCDIYVTAKQIGG